ncbi:MAG: tryptophan synthase subunit alpha [Actinomycetota bacterium]|nr:tryptophan synthase subunit alpha [Actinomycetota bacterium]
MSTSFERRDSVSSYVGDDSGILRSGSSPRLPAQPVDAAAESSLQMPESSAAMLTEAFRKGRPALVTYLMGGYPDRATSLESLRAAAAAGADVIELGVPYGDALADGPVIVRAANVARRVEGGFGLREAIALAAEFLGHGARSEHSAGVEDAELLVAPAEDRERRAPCPEETPPLALMTYYNPMLRLGLERTAQLARDAGVAGFIVPDMPPDVAGDWLSVSGGLDTVFLVAPTSTYERLALVGQRSSGFVYCVSTTGVTGERSELPPELAGFVARVREHTQLPLAVGFGVGTPQQAAGVAALADGVVVGSAIVRRQGDPAAVGQFVSELADAVHGAQSG